MSDEKIELFASKLHDIYIQEAKRQHDVRHKENYEDLPENIKEYDRVFARYVLDIIDRQAVENEALKADNADYIAIKTECEKNCSDCLQRHNQQLADLKAESNKRLAFIHQAGYENDYSIFCKAMDEMLKCFAIGKRQRFVIILAILAKVWR